MATAAHQHPDHAPSIVALARARSIGMFAAFALGMMVARSSPAPWSSTLWFSLALAAVGFSIVMHRSWWIAPLLAAAISIGAGWYTLRIIEPLRGSFAAMLEAQGARDPIITLRGIALTHAIPAPRSTAGLAQFVIATPKTRIDFRASEMLLEDGSWSPAQGSVWVRVSGREPLDISPGDSIELTGTFGTLDGPSNPGEDDIRLLAAERGFVGSLSLSSPSLIRKINPSTGIAARTQVAWMRFRGGMQARARSVVLRASGEDPQVRSLLLGLLLGEFDPTQRDVYNAFARQGLVHILSISGFHLSVMAAVVLLLVRLTGDRGWIEPAIVALLVLTYACIVPPSSPVIRSAAMVLILLLAHASGRRYDPVTLLAWIALGLVVWRPCDLWSLGFQLSLGMTGALFWLAHSLNARIFNQPLRGTVRFREHRWKDRLSAICQEAITANVLCYSLSLPVLIYRIGWISPLAIVVSIVVTPLVIVTLWIGYIALLVGMAIPAAAGAASSLLGALATWTVGVVTWADGLSFSSLHVPPVSALWTACATLAIIAALRLGFRRRDKPARSAAVLGSLAVCGCWLVVEWTVLIRLSPSTAMRIDMLDVGDGSCLFVRSGNQAILWDCGTLSSTGVQTRVIDAARALNIYETPTVVVTHPDIDHFGGILDVAKTLGIRLVLIPRRFFDEAAVRPRGAAAYGLKELSRRGIVVREIAEGDSLQVGAVAVRFLSPPKGAEFEKDNNHSLVGLWCKPNGRPEGDVEQYVLTTGDIEDDAISSLANRYPHLQPIVLELPHHGSAHRRSIEWVDELSPRVVLQSTGPRRANDPRWAAAKEGKRWYTTAISGAAWVEIGMDGGIRSGSHKPEEPSKR